MVAVAIGGAAVLGAGASVYSSSKASKAQKKAAKANAQVQTDTYSANKAVLQPYVDAGLAPTRSIQALLGLGGTPATTTTTPYGNGVLGSYGTTTTTPAVTSTAAANAAFDQFRNSTGYQFRLNEGTKALTAALGNKGMLESGAADKAAIKYGQDTASNEFARYYSMLTGQQEVGRSAAAAVAGVGTNYANAISASNTAAGNAQANNALSTGQAINGALQTGVSAYAMSAGLKSSYGSGTSGGGTWI